MGQVPSHEVSVTCKVPLPISTWDHAPECSRCVFKSCLRSFLSRSALSLVEKAAWKSGREYIAIWLVLFSNSRFIFFPPVLQKGTALCTQTRFSHVLPGRYAGSRWCAVKQLTAGAGWKSVPDYSCSQDLGCRLLPCSFSPKAAVAPQWAMGLQGGQMRPLSPAQGERA